MIKNRNISLDFLKGLAIIMVVVIHVTATIPGKGINNLLNYQIYRLLLNLAVPFFFAASGYIVAIKSKDNKLYCLRHSVKALYYYILANIFYIFFTLPLFLKSDQSISGVHFNSIKDGLRYYLEKTSIQTFINSKITTETYWFLIALFFGLLILGILIYINIEPLLIISMATLLFYANFNQLFLYPILPWIFRAFFFVSMGYFIENLDPPKHLKNKTILFFTSISVGTYAIIAALTPWTDSVYGHWSQKYLLPLIIASLIFVLPFWQLPNNKYLNAVAKLGTLSLGIYIYHIIFLRYAVYLGYLSWGRTYYYKPMYYLLATVLIIVASYFASLLSKRVLNPAIFKGNVVQNHSQAK